MAKARQRIKAKKLAPYEIKKIKVGKNSIYAFLIPLQKKNLILFKGNRGYAMCGYLNLGAANKFKDSAIKITKVASIKEALRTKVHSLTHSAKKLGIYKGQPIKDVLKIITTDCTER